MQDLSTLWAVVFAAALLLGVLLKLYLSWRQARHVWQHRNQVPAAFAQAITLQAHQKAADYTLAKGRLGTAELAWSTVILLGWTLLGGLSALDALIGASPIAQWGPLAQQVTLVAAFALIGALLDLPLSWYATFRLEERFGFNKMTPGLWLGDLLKSSLVGAVIGLPILALILWLMGSTGSWWWLWAWCAWMGFNLLILVLYPTVIAPLFNKFEPLQDEQLKSRVSALMQRCGFAAKGLFVMDGSKRSAHAVLAHELGHFRHKHIVQRIVMLFGLSLAALWLLGWLSQQVWFYSGLGVQAHMGAPNDALALLLFLLVVPVFSYFVSPLSAHLSRRHEFQADAYACAQTSGNDLSSALLKLYKDNASTLTPDPVFARFYYSHPPASERLARMGPQASAS